MPTERHTVELAGCAPVPLAHYLKALGVLRLVAEAKQVDADARGYWSGDTFFLDSRLDRAGIVDFFLNRYKPSAIIAPWNGGSGFNPKDNQTAINAIMAGSAQRLDSYRAAITVGREAMARLGITEKVDSEQKPQLLLECRNALADDAIQWLDAAVVLTGEGPKYPPLLGTGGNDGRLDFTNNFMQRLCDVVDPASGDPSPKSPSWLAVSLFGETSDQLHQGAAIGQFDPASAGGANATAGYGAGSLVNPWDYLLMLEGSLLFAAAAAKRLEDRDAGVLSYPFCVRPSGVGYGSSSLSDEGASRAEMWFPLWSRPTTLAELEALFSEGRATVNRRAARSGVDFARAVASFGVDRGIRDFQRYGFQQRNGLAYFAVPLGRFAVSRQPRVDLLNENGVDDWLDRFRRAATSDNAPARAGRALRRLEAAILELCRRAERRQVQEVLIALGEAESAVAGSARWRENVKLNPVPPLSGQWLADSQDESAEFRLAASLAAIHHPQIGPLRRHLEPVEIRGKGDRTWAAWSETPDHSAIVWGAGGLMRNLIAVLRRRVIEAERGESLSFPGDAAYTAGLGDIALFIDGVLDEDRIESLLKGLILIDWNAVRRANVSERLPRRGAEPFPGAAYALLKLCHLPWKLDDAAIPTTPTITHRAAAGDIGRATALAGRRLHASGYRPAVEVVPQSHESAYRTAAALMFPISWGDAQKLKRCVIRPKQEEIPSEDQSEPELSEQV